MTIPGREVAGTQAPRYLAPDEIKDIFIGMGFTVLDSEVELAEYNLDKLNAEEGQFSP